MKLVIGLSGRMGSGKTVVSDYLHEKYGAEQMRFSRILSDVLERLHIDVTRESLQRLGHGLRECMGEDVLVNAFRGDIADDPSSVIVVDGVRYHNEVDMLHSFENGVVLYIDAPAEVRYGRCVRRGEKGEANISFEDFLEAEGRATERFLEEVKERSDYVIVNDSSLDDLFPALDKVISERRI